VRLDFFSTQPHPVVVNIETQPAPDGKIFRHSIFGNSDHQPDGRLSDALLDLEHRDGFPQVTVWETDDGTWGVEVTVWDHNEEATPEQVAALEGTLAEVIASSRI
jgi:hypothetical protein